MKKEARRIATSAEMQKRIKKEIIDPLIKWADDEYAICLGKNYGKRMITERIEKALIEKMSSSSEQKASVSDTDIDEVFNRAKEDYLSEAKAEIDKIFPEMAEGLMEKLL